MVNVNNDKYVIIGRFGKAFGVTGWIKIISFTSPIEQILSYQPWCIRKNRNDSVSECYIEDSKIQCNHIVAKFSNYNSIEEIKMLSGYEIGIWRTRLTDTRNGEYYWSDLEGLKVINNNKTVLGVVQECIITGSNDVLVIVNKNKKRYLVPYLSSTISNVDLNNGIIWVKWFVDD